MEVLLWMNSNWSATAMALVTDGATSLDSTDRNSTMTTPLSTVTDDSVQPLFTEYPDELLHFAVGACVLFTLLGVPGNFITIVALLRYTKVRNATAMFIINLSVSDLMFCCFNLPLATSLFYHRAWVHGEALCTLFPLMRYGLLAVSIFTVLAITLNRYIMIGHPRLYPKLYKRRHLILMIALTWLGCFGSLLPTLLGEWGTFGLDKEIGSCSILPDAQRRSPKEFLFVVAFVLPCLAIVVCYARIFFIVRRAAAVSHGNQQQQNHQNHQQSGNAAGLKPSSSVRSRTGIGGIVPGEMRRGLMLPGSASGMHPGGGYIKQTMITGHPSVMEASFHLTCCESQQGSGSTEISEETTDRSAGGCSHHLSVGPAEPLVNNASSTVIVPKRTGSILRWNKPSQHKSSPIRIEVEKGSEVAGPLPEFQQQLSDKRRISVSFMEPEQLDDCPQSVSSSEAQYLRVPGVQQCSSNSSSAGGMNLSTSQKPLSTANAGSDTEDAEPVIASPVPSEASSIGSTVVIPEGIATPVGGDTGRSVLGAALSQVSGALHRRSTRNKSSTRRHPGRMTAKDRKLLQMILVIFVSFIVCYMPITLVKSLSKEVDLGGAINIVGYVLIYLTTCINPIIYVVMSSEYRQAYKNLLTCKQSHHAGIGGGGTGIGGGGGLGGGPLPSRSFSQKAY
ncbi:G-protein coupled receptor moody-like isoform X1 [Daphnia carinata]|uniref:G-protein coupled receptor moody-like isoform X1 n=2 Tax=Daphnia carinata TaxID=120202 RepID=UPI00257A4031|nr:G-protein coupled receptor moody-like isoform X1 [Daphnia carinata]